MEDVFLDFELDEYYDHIDNRGWMNLFQHWAWSGMLCATWAMTGFDVRSAVPAVLHAPARPEPRPAFGGRHGGGLTLPTPSSGGSGSWTATRSARRCSPSGRAATASISGRRSSSTSTCAPPGTRRSGCSRFMSPSKALAGPTAVRCASTSATSSATSWWRRARRRGSSCTTCASRTTCGRWGWPATRSCRCGGRSASSSLVGDASFDPAVADGTASDEALPSADGLARLRGIVRSLPRK